METKKSPKANLENKKSIFFEIGLVVAIGTILLAFGWKTDVADAQEVAPVGKEAIVEDFVPVTVHEVYRPMQVRIPRLVDIVDIVPDDQEVDTDIDIDDVDANVNNTVISWEGTAGYGTEDTGEVLPFHVVEEMPEFLEGNLMTWIAKHIKYPVIAQENNLDGRVYVQFVVERDGSVSNVEVIKGIDASLDKEAIRVVSSMPKWKPGKQRGMAVRVAYTLPITFTLR